MSVTLGWDIGGAHLKLARIESGKVAAVRQLACPLWLGLDRLTGAIDEALSGWPAPARHALTMTAELSDLFPDRASGVRAILETMGQRLGAPVAVYASDGGFLDAEAAAAAPECVASVNWHATAQLVATALGDGLLADIGSTTTDLVPLVGGVVAAAGVSDAERLACDELVYRGVVRTPVMALARRVSIAGERVGVMAELFATSADLFRLTGDLPEDADRQPSADGRGKSLAESRARLARMVGRDAGELPEVVWDRLARDLAGLIRREIAQAARRVLARAGVLQAAPVIGAGAGRFLAASLARNLGRPYRDYATLIPAADERVAAAASVCAPAVAVALLAERPMAARSRAIAAGSSGASRPPVVSAERKPR